jgi:hypothetical protein
VIVKQRAVEGLRDPDAEVGSYRSRLTASSGETIVPVAVTGPVIQVQGLFD